MEMEKFLNSIFFLCSLLFSLSLHDELCKKILFLLMTAAWRRKKNCFHSSLELAGSGLMRTVICFFCALPEHTYDVI
jgi:hypothetical protein